MKKRSNWYEKRIKKMGYKGCRNCTHQIASCEYLERGGDGALHLICPRWERKEE